MLAFVSINYKTHQIADRSSILSVISICLDFMALLLLLGDVFNGRNQIFFLLFVRSMGSSCRFIWQMCLLVVLSLVTRSFSKEVLSGEGFCGAVEFDTE